MPGRPKKACSTCKAQKIRCTGERPACTRCARLKHSCIYSGTQSVRKEKARQPDSSLARSTQSNARPLPSLANCPDECSNQNNYLGIPTQLVAQLVAVYFDNVANAALLLHKPSILQALHAGTVTPHVLLSICASGANFYRDCHGFASLKTQGFMIEWAQRAGRLAFNDIESFDKDLAVTFLNLSLFWYGQGSWKVSSLHRANALHSLCINGIGDAQQKSLESFDAELQRRRFWAWYIMHCHDGGRSTFALEPVGDMQNLPLPWCEGDFAAGVLTTSVMTLGSVYGSNSIFAELAKIAAMWSSTVNLIKSPQYKLTSDRMAEILALDHNATRWWQALPANFKLSPSSPLAFVIDDQPLILLANLFYHQIICVLHASIVPLFSWTESDNGWSSARQLSAQIAFEHANSVSALISATLLSSQKLSAMPTFVAYAAYGGCAIQIPFMWSSNSMLRHQAQANVRSNIQMIRAMAEYWKFAALLTVHVRCLYNIHKKRPPALEDEPKSLDVRKLTEFRVESLYARISILEFLRVLRKGQGSLAEPGEETTDLGIRHNESENEASADRPCNQNILNGTEALQQRAEPLASSSLPTDERLGLSALIQSQQWNLIPPESNGIETFTPAMNTTASERMLGDEFAEYMPSVFSASCLDIDGWDSDPFL